MLVDSITCSPSPSYPYHIAAKRYFVHDYKDTVEQQCVERDNDLTLVFLHSASFPKEVWEPTIEGLLQTHNRWGTRIREAYAIDCPNHGVAAVLNDGLLGDFGGVMNFTSFRADGSTDNTVLHHGLFSRSRDEVVCRMCNAVPSQWPHA